MLFGIIPLSFSALIMVCTMARRSAERRAAAAARAAAEQAAALKKAQAEAARRAAQDRAATAEAARRAAAEQKKQAAAQKKQERERRAAEAHAQKVARAAELAELAERRLQAEKELLALQQAAQQPQEQPAATPDDHSKTPAEQAQEPEPQQPAAPVLSLDQFAQAAAPAPQPFKGQTVAFTGKLTISGMTHAQAREKVKQAGGTAFVKEMPTSTTLLIVGENPGMKKLDKADAWINQVRKMTEQQFLDMLASA